MSEIRIWTYPWQAESTLEAYRERFATDVARQPEWRTERRNGREVLVLE